MHVSLFRPSSKGPPTELELQRSWYQSEIIVRQEYHEENELERKSLIYELEGTLTTIENSHAEHVRAERVTHAEQMRAEKATLEQKHREATRFHDEKFVQQKRSTDE